jgi:hypothetical protein
VCKLYLFFISADAAHEKEKSEESAAAHCCFKVFRPYSTKEEKNKQSQHFWYLFVAVLSVLALTCTSPRDKAQSSTTSTTWRSVQISRITSHYLERVNLQQNRNSMDCITQQQKRSV